jgi:hypothetical protein
MVVAIALQYVHVAPPEHSPGKQFTTGCSARQRQCRPTQSSGMHWQSGPLLKHVDPAGHAPSQVG